MLKFSVRCPHYFCTALVPSAAKEDGPPLQMMQRGRGNLFLQAIQAEGAGGYGCNRFAKIELDFGDISLSLSFYFRLQAIGNIYFCKNLM